MRTIDKINEKERDYNHLVETTLTYYSELRSNNPFAATNKTIADSEYEMEKLNKMLERYDEELDKLSNEPITQESANREYELLQARKDAETEIHNLQTTLENAYYQQRLIDIQQLKDEEEKKANEQNWQNQERELNYGNGGETYNTELQALQVL